GAARAPLRVGWYAGRDGAGGDAAGEDAARRPATRRLHGLPGLLARAERADAALEQIHLPSQLLVLHGESLLAWREVVVVLPPVEADLLRLVDGADDEANADGEELDLGQGDLDVAGDH